MVSDLDYSIIERYGNSALALDDAFAPLPAGTSDMPARTEPVQPRARLRVIDPAPKEANGNTAGEAVATESAISQVKTAKKAKRVKKTALNKDGAAAQPSIVAPAEAVPRTARKAIGGVGSSARRSENVDDIPDATVRDVIGEATLSLDEERALFRAWQDNQDHAARDKIITSHRKIPLRHALKNRNYGISVEELMNEGVLGLIRAMKTFDHSHNCRFSTYATWWVEAYIRNYIIQNFSMVKLPGNKHQKKIFFRLRSLKSKVIGPDQEHPTDDQYELIANTLQAPVHHIRDMDGYLSQNVMSIDSPVTGAEGVEGSLSDRLPADERSPEEVAVENIEAARDRTQVTEALSVLSDRERTVVRLRHMNGGRMSLDAIGRELGVSRERVRQIELRALTKLRQVLTRIRQREGADADMRRQRYNGKSFLQQA